MKLTKNIFLILLLLLIFSTNELYSQDYKPSTKLQFEQGFYDASGSGGEWIGLSAQTVKNSIVSRVSSDYSYYGISVSTTSGDILVRIYVNNSKYNFGEEITGIGSFINVYHGEMQPKVEVYVNSFYNSNAWKGEENATEARIIEGIAGVIAHEAGHLYNLFHAYLFNPFDPTASNALRSDYQPKEPDDLPSGLKGDPCKHEHLMAASTAETVYITNEQMTTINRYFAINSMHILNFITDGGGSVTRNITWGISDITDNIPNNMFDQKSNIYISSGKTLIIADGGYIHNLVNKTIQGGTLEEHDKIIPIDAPENFNVQNTDNGVLLTWNSVTYATSYKV